MLAMLNVEKGDYLYVTQAPDGVRITANDPVFSEQMLAARAIMKSRRQVLHELAK
ncbi:MAG: hypothetical protein RLY82_1396 [Pseudomonadota bacterium]